MRRKQIRILKDHYENNFSLRVLGKRAAQQAPQGDPSSKNKVPASLDAGKIEEAKQSPDVPAETKTAVIEEENPHEKAGTEIEVNITFFPDKSLESMVNLKNLHNFSDYSWY